MKKEDLTAVISECGNYVEYLNENGKRVDVRQILKHDQYSRNKNSDIAYKENLEREEKNKEKYRKLDVNEDFVQVKRIINKALKELTQVETHCLAKLLTILEFNNNVFKLNNKRANLTNFVEFFGVSRNTTKKLFNKLEKLKIIKKIPAGRDAYFQLTKKYIVKGPFDKNEFYSIKIFQKELAGCIAKVEKLMKKEIKKLKSDSEKNSRTVFYPLTMFMALLPHVHPQTYLICNNIDDSLEEYFVAETKEEVLSNLTNQMENVEPLNEKEIWQVISGKKNIRQVNDHEKERMEDYIEILKKSGMIATFEGESTIMFFNPNLLFVTTNIKNPIIFEFVKSLFKKANSPKKK